MESLLVKLPSLGCEISARVTNFDPYSACGSTEAKSVDMLNPQSSDQVP